MKPHECAHYYGMWHAPALLYLQCCFPIADLVTIEMPDCAAMTYAYFIGTNILIIR